MTLRMTALMFAIACGKSAQPPAAGSGSAAAPGSQTERATATVNNTATPDDGDPCSASTLGLAGAKKLAYKRLRSGCRPKESPDPQLITNEPEFAKAVECPDKGTGDGHNWTVGMLVVDSRSPSPAEAGVIAYDDGKAITFVSMQRTSCPNDPQPTPGPTETHVFVAEPNGARTFAERACTVQRACP